MKTERDFSFVANFVKEQDGVITIRMEVEENRDLVHDLCSVMRKAGLEDMDIEAVCNKLHEVTMIRVLWENSRRGLQTLETRHHVE
jgi:hypothetical protein